MIYEQVVNNVVRLRRRNNSQQRADFLTIHTGKTMTQGKDNDNGVGVDNGNG